MRMNRKLITLLIVAAMVLAMAPAAFAGTFSDVPSDASYASAVERLAGLGFIDGVGDGRYDPESTYTRAQFAALSVKLLGLRSAADAAKGATAFSDVAADHWSSGWVNVATSMGIVRGMGDGTFAPDAPVTHAQALTMLVRALGYEPALKGTWPINVLVKAAELGLTSGVNVIANLPASRGEVAVFADNGVEVPMMIQVGAGDQVKYVVSGTESTTKKTLLTGSIGETVEGVLLASAERADIGIKANEVTLDSTTYKLNPGVKVLGLLGRKVKAAVRTIGSDKTIVGISESDTADFSEKVVKSYVATSVYQLELCDSWNATDGFKTCKVRDIASGANLFVNNVKLAKDALGISGGDTTQGGVRAAVKLNADDEITAAAIQKWNNAGLVSLVNTSKQRIEFKDDATANLEDFTLTVIRDGKLASLGDIKKGDAAYVRCDGTCSSTTRKRAVVYAYSNPATGKFGGADSKTSPTRIYVDGMEYVITDDYVSTNDGDDYDKHVEHLAANAEVTAYRDAIGRVFAVKTGAPAAETVKNYALAVSDWQEGASGSRVVKMRLVLSSGTRTNFDVNDDTKINGSTKSVESNAGASLAVAAAVYGSDASCDTDIYSTCDYATMGGSGKFILVTYETTSDGKTLTKVDVVKNPDGVVITTKAAGTDLIVSTDFDEDRDRIDGIKVDSGVVIFDVREIGSPLLDSTKVKVRTWSAIKKAAGETGDYNVDGRIRVIVLKSASSLEGALARSAVSAVPQWIGGDNWTLNVVNEDGTTKSYTAKNSDWEVTVGSLVYDMTDAVNYDTLPKGAVTEVEQAGSKIQVKVFDDAAKTNAEVTAHSKSNEEIKFGSLATDKYYYDAAKVVVFDKTGTMQKSSVDSIGVGNKLTIYTKGITNLIEIIVITD